MKKMTRNNGFPFLVCLLSLTFFSILFLTKATAIKSFAETNRSSLQPTGMDTIIANQPFDKENQESIAANLESSSQQEEDGTIPDEEIILWIGTKNHPYRVPPPPARDSGEFDLDAVSFSVNWNPAECEGTVTTWSQSAMNAFIYAYGIWTTLLDGNQTIEINACWRTDLPSNKGGSNSSGYKVNFPNAPLENTFFKVALANQLSRSDLNGSTAEMTINLNSNPMIPWYFGFDGNTPADHIDFVTVVLHEITHGLGFAGTIIWDDDIGNQECNGVAGTGCWGAGYNYPSSFDRFVMDASAQKLINSTIYTNPSSALGNQIISNNLYFNSALVKSIRLFAPTSYLLGSNIYHLDDDTYDDTSNALMTSTIQPQESFHNPGWITMSILESICWSIPSSSRIFVEGSFSGTENGTSFNPFNTVAEGAAAVPLGGMVRIYPGTYPENLTLDQEMSLSTCGAVSIGQ